MLGSMAIRYTVKATIDSFHETGVGQARECNPGRLDGVEIAGTQQSLPREQIEDASGMGVLLHGVRITFRFAVTCKVSTKVWNMRRPVGGVDENLDNLHTRPMSCALRTQHPVLN